MNYPNKILKDQKTFDDMVSVWLQDEWHSAAFSLYRENGEVERIIKNPNLTNEEENEKRKELLMMARGRQLKGLPKDTEWFEIEFSQEDLARTFLIPVHEAGWTHELTRGTFSIKDAVDNLDLSSDLIKNSIHKNHYEGIIDIENHLDSINKKIILLASNPASRFTVIEGNHRVIALARDLLVKGSAEASNFKVLLGISPEMKDYEFSVEKWRPEA